MPSQLFFAPAANKAVELQEDGSSAHPPVVLAAGRLARADDTAPAGVPSSHKGQGRWAVRREKETEARDDRIAQSKGESRAKQVQRARDQFYEIFSNLSPLPDSEYDERYRAFGTEAYANRPKPIRAQEKLSWWNGGHKPTQAEQQVQGQGWPKSFYQDQKPSSRRHFQDHMLGDEEEGSIWNSIRSAATQDEHESLTVAKPTQTQTFERKAPVVHRAPPETIDLTFQPGPPKPKSKEELDAMRNEFIEEMNNLHRVDLNVEYESEYDRKFRVPQQQQQQQSGAGIQVSSLASSTSRLDTEYDAAFKRMTLSDIEKVQNTRPAGWKPPRHKEKPFEISTCDAVPQVRSEYDTEFVSVEKMELLRKERQRRAEAREAAKLLSPRAGAPSTEYKEKYGVFCESVPEPEKPINLNVRTEYRDRFCHGGSTGILDPGCMPSPRTKKIHTPAPMLTEYNVEFDHRIPACRIEKKEPQFVIDEDDMKPGLTTEYEGQFCGADTRDRQEKVAQEIATIQQKNALTPAYSIRPSEGHKHKLFRAEINPGYVQRSEYMGSYKKPITSRDVLCTMRLPAAKRSEAETQKQVSAAELASALQEVPTKPILSHDDRIKIENRKSLKWWRGPGHRLWGSQNPITGGPAYMGVGATFKTPKTEYQHAFAA